MKKLFVAITALAVIGMAGNALAIGLTVGGGGGVLLPLTDFADMYKLGYGFGGGATIGVLPYLGIDVDFAYYLGMKNKAIIGTPPNPSTPEDFYKQTMTAITFGAHYNIISGGTFVPYAGGGGGFYMIKTKEDVTGNEYTRDTCNKPGFYFGGGLNYFISDKMCINFATKLHIVMVGDDYFGADVSKLMFMTIGGGIGYAVM